MRRITHIVNPVLVPESSDLHVAQPITFASMRAAQAHARGEVDVRLVTAQYPEDRVVVPEGFEMTRDLDRSVLDRGVFASPRKLPILADILDRLAEVAGPDDYCVYTNVDIGLQPDFYSAVNALIDKGYDGMCITRRTIDAKYRSVDDLPAIYADRGAEHPGQDCFVFSRASLDRFNLAAACIGARFIGKVLMFNSWLFAQRYGFFKDLYLTFHIGNDRVWSDDRFDDYMRHNALEARAVCQWIIQLKPDDEKLTRMVHRTLGRINKLLPTEGGNPTAGSSR